MSKDKKILSEKYMINLYPENEEHMKALEYIKWNMNYAYILHDKDITDDGEIKKEHIHVVVKFDNARELKALASELNIEPNMIKFMNSIKYSIRYLTHKDQKNKAQYNFEQIKTNMVDIKKYFKEESTEVEDMKKILEFIFSIDRYLYLCEVLEYVLSENIYATYRRSGTQIIKIIEEHNRMFLEKRENGNKRECGERKSRENSVRNSSEEF